ncbi:type II toxin-antitoxin system RelE/ParE family toxin [Sphingomonas sp. SUN039]|uniref:type II toxin-antitoxin system RelE/ParE family toxin n=1 Tax=Sphingomonas sp. SUN039 TaxID=2937787 RepID=UPI002164B171|nr:type II toxin-antitoxin system RelE/ParE family toxin [Sphingomonas sp. SUN039]UVO52915.1 type II toxin-antitoxin system RelE/ParE family toxin [Sphingomonas sp. SUN039]
MLELVWEPLATEQLSAIIEYIAQHNFPAAERLERQIHAKVELACHVPGMGRPGRVSETREIVAHPNYLVIYRVTDERLYVIRVLHSRQQYP